MKDERSDYILPGSDGRRNGGFRVLLPVPGQQYTKGKPSAVIAMESFEKMHPDVEKRYFDLRYEDFL